MLLDFEILKAFGTTNERLREIATAKPATDEELKQMSDEQKKALDRDLKIRKEWQDRIINRRNEAMLYSLKNYRLYAAADLAWDSTPINCMTVPLVLYAQNKIDIQQCSAQLQAAGCADKFLQKNDDGSLTVNLPKFVEVSVNLVRFIITRRLAAQANKYNNIWPYFKYESRSTGMVGKLRADVMSQRSDIMADQFGYRKHDEQVYREMFLYAHSIDFVRASWEIEKQWEKDPLAKEFATKSSKPPIRDVIMREGVAWVNPHPTRVFYDKSEPLSSINWDGGIKWIGYWHIGRFGDVKNDPRYFNQDGITFSATLWDIYASSQAYFTQYINNVKVPNLPTGQPVTDKAAQNDRQANIGIYATTMEDTSVFLTQMFEQIVPSAEGVGTYPFPIWIRKVVASDATIIYAEILPSTPAAYCGFNESDSRLINLSMAHEIMPFQDQLTNLFTEMLLTVQAELLKIVGINTDVLPEGKENEIIAEVRKTLKGDNWFAKPLVIEFSLRRLQDLGLSAGEIFKISETRAGQALTAIFQAMAQLIAMVEKLMAMSPAEQGQPAPREISATEVNEISNTTTSVYSFISDSIDDFRAAKKRIIYESTVALSEGDIQSPVKNRYSDKVIAAAGFKPVKDENDEAQFGMAPRQQTVIGSARKLVHDYIFTSRDGAERPRNTQAANTIVQLLTVLVQMPGVLQAIGKERLYNVINEVFRMSDVGIDALLELQEGEDDSLGADDIAALKQAIQQLAEFVKKNSSDIQQQGQVISQQEQVIESVGTLADQVKQMALDIERMNGKLINDKAMPKISYKDAPEAVKQQMELDAGYAR